MTDIVVYGIPGSPFMRAVQMGLEEKKAAYRIAVVGPGESKSEAYLEKTPVRPRAGVRAWRLQVYTRRRRSCATSTRYFPSRRSSRAILAPRRA